MRCRHAFRFRRRFRHFRRAADLFRRFAFAFHFHFHLILIFAALRFRHTLPPYASAAAMLPLPYAAADAPCCAIFDAAFDAISPFRHFMPLPP
jgi:hypothetical protein